MSDKGKVYLIGAGPGDPELLTLKGKKALEKSNCIVYDRLASSKLLSFASPGAEMIFVGKKPGAHSFTQEEINNLLVKKGLEGKTVARLKGGDPFVFGRGGEECLALLEHNITFEIIPGVTSAISVPSYAGIPVTHRECNSSFTVITGHEDPAKKETSLNWKVLASTEDTLIFLMGVGRLQSITEKLMEHGKNPLTPAALVSNGTTPYQRTLVSTLKDITKKAGEENFQPPSIIIIGEVVNLREKINWFEKLPLFSRTIIVTRAREQASALTEELTGLGARVMEFPVIKINPPESYDPLDKAIDNINGYNWVIFTSPNGVKSFLQRLYFSGKDVRALGNVKICAIGPQTSKELSQAGLIADYIPKKFVSEELVAGFPDIKPGTKILLPRAKEARDIIPEELSSKGLEVDIVTAYETVMEEDNAEELKELASSIDIITFTSSSTVKNFVELVKKKNINIDFNKIIAAAIGPVTEKTAKEYGFNVSITASEYTIKGLVEEIVKHYK